MAPPTPPSPLSPTSSFTALATRWRAALLAAGIGLLLSACAGLPGAPGAELQRLLPADAIVLGEQHDAPEHQQIHASVVQQLARRGQLAALALEMVEQGHSTLGLSAHSDATAVRRALHWNDAAWPWRLYGPAVMAAVAENIPVVGANLPRSAMRAAMQDERLDSRLSPSALQSQRQAIRSGHCELLPEAQIAPMTRVQIARDVAMAQTLVDQARAGGVVLLLAGAGHADRTLGIAQHLPPGLRLKAVRLLPGSGPAAAPDAAFDAVWRTPPVPPRDHCAELRRARP